MRRRARDRGARLGVRVSVAAALLSGCLDLSTGANEPFALEFDGIPYPAVLAEDTLRDALGVAAPLEALVYDGAGNVIAGAPVTFVSLDTGATITAAGVLATTMRTGSLRVVATAGGLQSPARTIIIARRPDTTFTEQDTLVPFTYALPDVAANVTPDLRVRLQTTDTVGGLGPNVEGWLVRWRAVHAGDTLAPGDTTLVSLVTPAGSRSETDTTDNQGQSVRRIRIYADRLVAGVDSFVVVAEVKRHGTSVSGTPVVFLVKVAPPPP